MSRESASREINTMFDNVEKMFEGVDISKLPRGKTGPVMACGPKGSTDPVEIKGPKMVMMNINGCLVPQIP
jgi:hypothetical protein